MEDLIVEFKQTGPCTVDVDKVVNAWTDEFSISQWEEEYRLIKGNKEECAKVTITPEQAKEIISKAKLLPIKSSLFRSGVTHRSKSNIESEMKRIQGIYEQKRTEYLDIKNPLEMHEKQQELGIIKSVITEFENALKHQ